MIGQQVQTMSLEAYVASEPEAKQVRLADHHGSWVVLLFYPRDVTYPPTAEWDDVVVLAARSSGSALDVQLGDRPGLGGTFVIDPEGIVRSASAVVRNADPRPEEALRTVRMLRTGAIGAFDRQPGQEMLRPAA